MHLTALCTKVHTGDVLELVASDEFEDWYQRLSEAETAAVTRAVSLLESMGKEHPRVRRVDVEQWVTRGRPVTLFELAVEDPELFVLFAFESEERAVLLYGFSPAEIAGSAQSVAHVLLAAKIYFQYREGKEKSR
jgi:hypothetical protein